METIRKILWYLPFLILIVLPIIGWSLDWPIIREFREKHCRRAYQYVNTDLICESTATIDKTGYLSTQNDIGAYIEKERTLGHVAEVSVYFRDMRDGPVFGINETADFAPASLMKLPLVFALFHIEEEQPGFLQQKTRYISESEGIPPIVQVERPSVPLTHGTEYTLEELMKIMLIYSDNDAYYTLAQYANTLPTMSSQVLATFQELGMIDPRSPEDEVVSVRGYAALYRLLYTASYLNATDSEKVLAWLSQSVYDKGLEAGLPASVGVAHKFGERGYDDTRQLHDCGIIYYPGNPYTLCIMTKGKDFTALAPIIAEISRLVYEEVDSRRF